MTKDKLQEWCERVLLSKIGDVIYRQFSELDGALDSFARELAEIGRRLDQILTAIDRNDR